MRDISAWNDQSRYVEAEQVFGLCAGRGVPVKRGASHPGHDEFVVVPVLPYKGIGEGAVTPDDRGPWPASGVPIERLAFFGDQPHDFLQAVLLHVRHMLCNLRVLNPMGSHE
jgi:hypothetical protein